MNVLTLGRCRGGLKKNDASASWWVGLDGEGSIGNSSRKSGGGLE